MQPGIEQSVILIVRGEQGVETGTKCGVTGAGVVEVGSTAVGRQGDGGLKQGFFGSGRFHRKCNGLTYQAHFFPERYGAYSCGRWQCRRRRYQTPGPDGEEDPSSLPGRVISTLSQARA